jgi:large subunit ribosomal protein L25
MERVSFKAEKRDTSTRGRNSQLRATGMIPAILYGHNVDGSKPIKLNEKTIVKLSRKGLKHLLFDLEFAGEQHTALVRDFQVDIITRRLMHVDFYSIDTAKPIDVDIPIIFEGVAKGTKEGGRVEQRLYRVNVKGLAEDIPDSVVIDITEADIGDLIHVRELEERPGVTFTTPEQVTVFVVRAPRKIEEVVEDEEGEGEEGAEGESTAEAKTE